MTEEDLILKIEENQLSVITLTKKPAQFTLYCCYDFGLYQSKVDIKFNYINDDGDFCLKGKATKFNVSNIIWAGSLCVEDKHIKVMLDNLGYVKAEYKKEN